MPTPVKTLSRPWLAVAAAAIAVAAGMSLAAAPAQANNCITNVAGVSDGSAAHPFLIADVENLECIRDNPLDYWAGKYFKQTADIDLASQPVWTTTIGDLNTTAFTGHYDGNGKKITGLRVALTTTSYAGLFGVTNEATISNLEIANATTSLADEEQYVGAAVLVGYASATAITNVHTSGTVTGHGVGGIAAEIVYGTTISSSSSSATIIGSGRCAGGLVGCAGRPYEGRYLNSITDSYATGAVTGDMLVGGLVGRFQPAGQITRSYATGAVTGRPAPVVDNGANVYTGARGYVGGLVGYIESDYAGLVAISESFATGSVTAQDSVTPTDPNLCGACVGGLVGASSGNLYGGLALTNSITDSYASGTVDGGISAGGLVGTNMASNLSITSSYSRSNLRGASSAQFGGILGEVRAAVGSIPDDAKAAAPVITPARAPAIPAFWNPTDADHAVTNSYGTEATQAAMKSPALYATAGWDIADTMPTTKKWVSCSAQNGGYPFLQWYGAKQVWSCSVPTPPDPTPPDPTPPDPTPPDPTPPGPTPPGPTPKPSNAFTLAPSGSSTSSLQSVITTNGPGVAQQQGSFSSLSGARSAKELIACTSSRKLAKAGRYTLGCKLTSAVRSARRRGAVRVLLRTTFTPTGGAARTITRVVTLKKTSSGVTG